MKQQSGRGGDDAGPLTDVAGVLGALGDRARIIAARPLRISADAVECVQTLMLLFDQHFGITDHVDEQDMGDLEFDLFFDLGGHEAESWKSPSTR